MNSDKFGSSATFHQYLSECLSNIKVIFKRNNHLLAFKRKSNRQNHLLICFHHIIKYLIYFLFQKHKIFYRKLKTAIMEQNKQNMPFSVKFSNNSKSHANLSTKLTLNTNTPKADTPIMIDRPSIFPCLQYSEDSITYEVQAEKQYVHRLRIQRQRIQALYSKYDKLLAQLGKKDKLIKEQQSNVHLIIEKLSELDHQFRTLTIMVPELQHFKGQHSQIMNENSILKNNLSNLESHYNHLVNEFKNKSIFKNEERQEFTSRNEQLLERIKLVTKKMQQRESERIRQEKILKGHLQQLKQQLNEQKNKHFDQLTEYRNQILQRNQQCRYLNLENEQLRQKLYQFSEVFGMQKQSLYEKINEIRGQKNARLKTCQIKIAELNTQNELLQESLNKLKQQKDMLMKQNEQCKQGANESRKINDESIYELKVIIMQERSLHRENCINYQNQILRIQAQLHSSRKKQEDLLRTLRRIQASDGMKRQIRQIQKQQLQKINRLLI